ncbi:MAG: Gluconolactonase [Labilithrix sp.]|nr:Gluconolactonase [Labilithrix sp.]
MSFRRRLGLVVVALPIAFYAYACSSDSSDGGGEGEDAGGGQNEGGPSGNDASSGNDGSTTPDAADASDGAVVNPCIGNPLTPDGGTADGGVALDAATTTQIVTALNGNFLDGPQWIDSAGGGFLVYSEYNAATPRLSRVAPDGGGAAAFRTTGFSALQGPLGNALRGGLVVTAVDAQNAAGTPSFVLTATDGGASGTIALGDAGATSPNDVVVGPNDNLYFTDGQYQNTGHIGTAGLYRILGDSGVVAVQQNFGRANGLALSPDKTKLYVGVGPLDADPDPRSVLVYTVAATGAVTAPGVPFLTATDLVDVPDGIAVDVGGNLWVAEAVTGGAGGGRVEVFGPDKKKLGTIPFEAPHRPTGVTFGGADGKTLFITTETGVFTYVSRCAGLK